MQSSNPNIADSARRRTTADSYPSTRDSCPASSERFPFDANASPSAGTPPASAHESSHYSEADEKRLHESDGHFWAHRRLSQRQSASPMNVPSRLQASITASALSDLENGISAATVSDSSFKDAATSPVSSFSDARNADLSISGDGSRVPPPNEAPSFQPNHAPQQTLKPPQPESLPQSHFAASPAEAAAAVAELGATNHGQGHAQPSLIPVNGVGAHNVAAHAEISGELRTLYESIQKCLELRDKYMGISLQGRMEDNPKNWDAEHCRRLAASKGETFTPDTPGKIAEGSIKVDGSSLDPETNRPKPWRIYPSPPRPHWELFNPPPASSFVVRPTSVNPLPPPIPPASPANASAAQSLLESTGGKPGVYRDSDILIPSAHVIDGQKVNWKMDENGVFQVYHGEPPASASESVPDARKEVSANGDVKPTKPMFSIPTMREYFRDLDYLLNVISDGPVKSFAWRRLKYLESKWNLYFLLNEYRELADMKRVPHR